MTDYIIAACLLSLIGIPAFMVYLSTIIHDYRSKHNDK